MPGSPWFSLFCALLCAPPWLPRVAGAGSPAQPLAQRRDPHDPARGADFDRVYSGVVNLSTETIYAFNYIRQPGQVRDSLPSLDFQELARSQSPVAALGPLGTDLGRPQGPGPLVRFLIQSNYCPAGAAASSATGLGNNSASFGASPPGLVAGFSELYEALAGSPARFAGPDRRLGLSLGKSLFLGSRGARTATLFPISRGKETHFMWMIQPDADIS